MHKATEQELADDYSDLPPRLRNLLPRLPEYLDRPQAAQLVRDHCFKIADRSIEVWWLPTRFINGRAHHPTGAVLREAQRRIDSAPERMHGRPPTAVIGVGRGRRRAQAGGPAPPPEAA